MAKRELVDRAEQVFTWGIFAFVVGRFVVAYGALKQYGVNPWVFGVIDIVTAWPYAKSWPRLVVTLARREWQAAVFWLTILTGSFAAPYVYLGIAGSDMPVIVWIAIGVFVGGVVTIQVRNLLAAVRSKAGQAIAS